MSDKLVQQPKTPTGLTNEFLTDIINREYAANIEIESFQTQECSAGVLSQVIMLDVIYRNTTDNPPSKFVVKYPLPELPLENMLVVESRFYRELSTKSKLPFCIPRSVFASSSMLMTERIEYERNFTDVEGCPKELVIKICMRLAELHYDFLRYDCRGLASPAGIGSSLDGISKEMQFASLWREFLMHISSISDTVRFKVEQICKSLSTRRLRDVHNTIHNHKVRTLIHGDFHVANMLFSKDDIWLLDWGSCGQGFPLVDVAFFAIVSLTTSVRRAVEADMLMAYHKTFASTELPLESCKYLYRLCILNQFLVLVCYDRMTRDIVKQAKQPEQLSHHFNEVNLRACHALIDCFNDDLIPREKNEGTETMQPPEDFVMQPLAHTI